MHTHKQIYPKRGESSRCGFVSSDNPGRHFLQVVGVHSFILATEIRASGLDATSDDLIPEALQSESTLPVGSNPEEREGSFFASM